MSKAELVVMSVFRKYLMNAGQMLCFDTAGVQKHRNAMRTLMEKGYLIEERFKGGFSLTNDGFVAMNGAE